MTKRLNLVLTERDQAIIQAHLGPGGFTKQSDILRAGLRALSRTPQLEAELLQLRARLLSPSFGSQGKAQISAADVL